MCIDGLVCEAMFLNEENNDVCPLFDRLTVQSKFNKINSAYKHCVLVFHIWLIFYLYTLCLSFYSPSLFDLMVPNFLSFTLPTSLSLFLSACLSFICDYVHTHVLLLCERSSLRRFYRQNLLYAYVRTK